MRTLPARRSHGDLHIFTLRGVALDSNEFTVCQQIWGSDAASLVHAEGALDGTIDSIVSARMLNCTAALKFVSTRSRARLPIVARARGSARQHRSSPR